MKTTCCYYSSVLAALVGLFFSSTGTSMGSVYYDLDLEEPHHTAGLAVTYDETIFTPARPTFGQVDVVNDFGSMPGQSMLFNTTGNDPSFFYDQIRFELGHNEDFYAIAFDLYTEELIGSKNRFKVLFDLPSAYSFTFTSSGSIDFWKLEEYLPTAPGTIRDRTVHRVLSTVDVSKKVLSLYIDGQAIAINEPLSICPACRVTDVRSVRMSLGTWISSASPDNRTYVAIDNLFIAKFVPEPASIFLVLFGGGALCFTRRVARRSASKPA